MAGASKTFRQLGQSIRMVTRTGLIDRPLMAALGAVLLDGARVRMEQARDPKGRKLAPLDKGYAAWKIAGGRSASIWQLTGESKRRLAVTRITASRCVIQINTPYSGFVHDGTKSLPARPVLGISDADEAALLAVIEKAQRKKLEI